MANAMFRSDNLAGTVHGKNLASVRMAEDLENGCIVALGGYEAGSREVREYSAPEADTAIEKIAILGSEEVNKEVKFDTVVETMYQTGKDLKHHYRETSEGGLAANYEA